MICDTIESLKRKNLNKSLNIFKIRKDQQINENKRC
jgi:hypothetical protein